jgi:cytochrome c-type biogenesis protein CcmE
MKGKLAASLIVVFVMLVLLLLLNAGKTEVSRVYLPSELIELAKENGSDVITRVRLAARVAEGEIQYQVEPEIKLQFLAKNPPNKDGTPSNSSVKLPIVYNGIKPDMFAVERDVIVDGELRQGTFYASKLLTQCPSKYEAPKPEHS